MRNKFRLKGRACFVENYLTWEERQVQGKINRWVKEEREKERIVKRGYARVCVEGTWIKWSEIEARLKEKEKNEGEVIGKGSKEGISEVQVLGKGKK